MRRTQQEPPTDSSSLGGFFNYRTIELSNYTCTALRLVQCRCRTTQLHHFHLIRLQHLHVVCALEGSRVGYILLAHEVPCIYDYTTLTWYDCKTFM